MPPIVEGDYILANAGKVQRYRGNIPRLNPVALLSAGQAIARMNAMAKKVPLEAPWTARRAASWDAQTVRSWLTPANVPTQVARDLVDSTVRACFAADLSEVSLLNWLFLVHASGGIEALMSLKGGLQDSQFEGGMGQVPEAMAAELGDAVVLGAPATAITQSGDRVEVTSDVVRVQARRVVLALPRALAAGIRFEPALPADHALLVHQMPAGTEVKLVAIYDEPFWRADGANGATVAMDDWPRSPSTPPSRATRTVSSPPTRPAPRPERCGPWARRSVGTSSCARCPAAWERRRPDRSSCSS